jgi:CRP-like cAMP-binding protein
MCSISYKMERSKLPKGIHLAKRWSNAARDTSRHLHFQAYLLSLGPSDFFGERALLTAEPRAANVVATSPVQAMALDRETFTVRIALFKLCTCKLGLNAATLLLQPYSPSLVFPVSSAHFLFAISCSVR